MIDFTYRQLADLLGSRPWADVPCVFCGPTRSTPRKAAEKKLRLFPLGDDAVSYYCARCGEHGYAHGDRQVRVDPAALARYREEAAKAEQGAVAASVEMARWLWRHRRSIRGSLAERYLIEVRGIRCPLPATIGFLPARDQHPPAMIAAFGMATEPEPGVLAFDIGALRAVHLTKLNPDGDKVADGAKIMVGRGAVGVPIILAPPNDLLGIVIGEGVEDSLSAHAATSLGAWASASASRLPALADAVPHWIDCVSIIEDADEVGRSNARELADRLKARGIYAELVGG